MAESIFRSMSRPVRVAAARAADAILEPLEARRLLVAGFLDGNFGGGDGYALIDAFTEPTGSSSNGDPYYHYAFMRCGHR